MSRQVENWPPIEASDPALPKQFAPQDANPTQDPPNLAFFGAVSASTSSSPVVALTSITDRQTLAQLIKSGQAILTPTIDHNGFTVMSTSHRRRTLDVAPLKIAVSWFSVSPPGLVGVSDWDPQRVEPLPINSWQLLVLPSRFS